MVMAVPASIPFVPASVAGPTDSARRDNQLREVITQVSQNEQFNRERGLGSNPERAPLPGLPSFAKQLADARQGAEQIKRRAARGEDGEIEESSQVKRGIGEDDAEVPDEQRVLGEEEKGEGKNEDGLGEKSEDEKKVEELKQRDAEVRRHEEAHANVGGQYAGSPTYEFEKGPDGTNYAVGGEVQIDVSEVPGDPAATLQKMQIVRRAALAPEEPSSADRQVAADASRKEAEARQDLAEQRREEASQAVNTANSSVRSADQFSDDELDALIERGSRIEQAYQGSFRPRESAVLAQA
ncbi:MULTISPECIES: putative metalloprotease CJM1_0395 family protein [Gammaproteobacteria]|uniref:putative metalloprotease CJM1_0395 family protein n=1 Tax=Gammaproteobacteria TaxID=1236 RepID=UPI000DD0E584|nr:MULTISPECIES: putative metalloprotease CJM1_0395 family protein [Gammaproteobacteria]RTE86454.1 catalase [Aliidiomarina sp. B3213]TCZ90991.1 catalase [Lysobacter sp. N42]